MNNPYYPRGSGRTTRMLIQALASDKEKVAIVSPTMQMAKYTMDLFIDLIERISNGRADIKAKKSGMSVEFYEKIFFFIGADSERSMDHLRRNMSQSKPVYDEFKDHTCYEINLKAKSGSMAGKIEAIMSLTRTEDDDGNPIEPILSNKDIMEILK